MAAGAGPAAVVLIILGNNHCLLKVACTRQVLWVWLLWQSGYLLCCHIGFFNFCGPGKLVGIQKVWLILRLVAKGKGGGGGLVLPVCLSSYYTFGDLFTRPNYLDKNSRGNNLGKYDALSDRLASGY